MKRLLKRVLADWGYRIEGTRHVPRQLLEMNLRRPLEFDDVVCRRMFEFGPDLGFIQIGAFDGVMKDPLRKFIISCGWRGVLVEPQKRAAGKLRDLYRGNDAIVILQAALDRTNGRRKLFTVDSEAAPGWASALASFDRSNVAKHASLVPGLEEMISEETVDCVTFDEVLDGFPGERVDLLQIDAEGSDAEILALFPYDRLKPPIIHFEIVHLSKAQREDCLGRLASLDYRFAPSGDQDMMALQF